MVRDVILQATSQAAAHRLVTYATSPNLQAFPRKLGFCDGACELGLDPSSYNGPALVLFQNCKVTPTEFLHHIMGCFLRGYIMRIYWCDHVSASKTSFPMQLMDLVTEVTNPQICNLGENRLEDTTLDLLHMKITSHEVKTATHNKALSNTKFRLQTFPRGLATELIKELPHLDFALHHFSHSLYVVEIDGSIRYGIGNAQDMYLTACDADALFKGFVARACAKLEEALHVKGITLGSDMLALDIGAAPGAWTELLSKIIHQVVAVDPGQLDKRFLGKRVTHICKKAENAIDDLTLWMKEKGKFDLLVCDINKHPVEAAEIVLPLLQFLKPGGRVIMTLKFHGRGKDKIQKVAEIEGIFKDSLREMESIWLLANSIYERTFIGMKP